MHVQRNIYMTCYKRTVCTRAHSTVVTTIQDDAHKQYTEKKTTDITTYYSPIFIILFLATSLHSVVVLLRCFVHSDLTCIHCVHMCTCQLHMSTVHVNCQPPS
eukprot:GHVS01012968.1.p1 GENE.GHVS01012968.1~~GHVS01012968.1.p1  ORF type:complete len:103 (+),score=9.72 GHVS01012968.1:125-433(+)